MAQYIKTEEGYKKFATVTDNKMDNTNPTGTGSFSMNIRSDTVIGVNSHAEGNQTTASGNYSHSEGNQTIASGFCSHVEGDHATASGTNSHAEGSLTTASGQSSHAEGNSTNKFSSVVTKTNPTKNDIITAWKTQKFSVAKGECSHVEGKNNLALNDYSHAEGYQTIASKNYSHAEGSNTTASGDYSHVEGNYTTASGDCSHAEGGSTKASGNYSHTEGNGTRASGLCSHAEGGSTNQFSSVVTTTNPTIDSIITDWKTKKFSVAKGNYSHVEGKDSLALNDYSHAEGYWTTASGNNSHAEGDATIASAYSSHAEGSYTTASGTDSHAEGDHTTANGEGSHVQGKYNIADTSNIYADIIGNGTSDTARSNAATVDWNGNAWFAGDVYTGSTSGTNKDNGSKKLATEEYVNNSIANIPTTDLSNCVQTDKENILGDNGSIISNSGRGNSLTISNGVIEQKNSNQDSVSLGNAKVVFSHDNDGSSSTRGNGTFTMYGRKGEEYFKFNGTNGDVRVSGIATPTLQNDAVNKSYVDSQIANIKIPTASATALGGVKVGAGLAIADDGTLSFNIASAAVGQIIKVKAIDENGKPTEWEAVDDKLPNPTPSDAYNVLSVDQIGEFEYGYVFKPMPDINKFISLGLTSAAVGQIIKVKAVDDSGKPTAWEAADIPSAVTDDHINSLIDAKLRTFQAP